MYEFSLSDSEGGSPYVMLMLFVGVFVNVVDLELRSEHGVGEI